MKRILSVMIVICFLFTLTGCNSRESNRKEIFDLVERNYDAIVAACQSKDIDALTAIDGITKVTIADGYVLMFCKGEGIAPSSQYYGFYYSEENSPIAVDCAHNILCRSEALTPNGSGFQYSYQGNLFYTEHIKGNLYFYRAEY